MRALPLILALFAVGAVQEETTIEFVPVVELGGTTRTDGLVCEGARLARVRDRYYVTECVGQTVLVFSESGELVGRLGGRGQGPGEFSGAVKLYSLSDGLLVLSGGNRQTEYGPDGTLLATRTHRRAVFDVASLEGGVRVESYVSREPSTAGQSLHVGKRSFGLANGEAFLASVNPVHYLRLVAPSSDRTLFWASYATQYKIELLDGEGQIHRTVEPNVPWFEAYRFEPAPLLPDRSPDWENVKPTVYDLMESNGVLWVLLVMNHMTEPTEINPAGQGLRLHAIHPLTGDSLAIRDGVGRMRFADGHAYRVIERGFDEFVQVIELQLYR